jgi:membrane protease YdiL (CAAX protease family)
MPASDATPARGYNRRMPRRTPVSVIAPPPADPAPLGPLVVVVVAYAAMMAVSFGQAVSGVLLAKDSIADVVPDTGVPRETFYETMVFEGVDTVIVLAAVVLASRPLRNPALWHRLGTWLLSGPGFLLLLGVNLGYHYLLQAVLQVEPDAGEPPESLARDGWWVILSTCVQPAFVEELFFRFLLLGHLRHHLGVHAAVWISSVMFGMAHLGNVPGWPVLTLIGAGLGYARVLSGGLALPIALHFTHNLVICLLEDATR